MKLDLFRYPSQVRIWLRLLMYASVLCSSLWLAYELRFDFKVDPVSQPERFFVLLWLVPLQLILLAAFHQFTPLLGYFSTPDLAKMFQALTVSSIIALAAWFAWGAGIAPPRGVILGNFVLALFGLTGIRLAVRTFRESFAASSKKTGRRNRRVAILGAGDAGAVLAHELSLKPGYGLEPVAFFDDDSHKWGSRVHGIPVFGAPETLLDAREKLEIQEAILAMPSATPRRVGDIVRLLRQIRLPCRIVPSLDQLALGQVRVSKLRSVEIQDLLGREHVELETDNIRLTLQDHVVLVTGAGGSIGTELCRQIASYHPKQLLLLDRSEPQLFQIEQDLIGLEHGQRIVPLVGDILDRDRMEQIFARYHPGVVFHSAAHKHVPMMEHQPGEAAKNNTFGTAQLADIALKYGASRFVLISTDKAINPTSVMGATKRLAEMYIQALFAAHPEQTKFMAVRFGNVLGSSGSVVPLFQKQIAEGGPVKVTHPEMTRYFMTIPEASMLVLQSGMQGTGGEIFVLDMGRPVRILHMARQMIELSGLKPDEDIQIEFTGIRPGEKLFEELSHKAENVVPTRHPKILRLVSAPPDLASLRQTFNQLHAALLHADVGALKQMLKAAVPEYAPFESMAGQTLPAAVDPAVPPA